MSDSDPTVDTVSLEATVAGHPARETQPFVVAPSPDGVNTFNTISQDLIPVACLSLNDALFEFDSSFVIENAAKILNRVHSLRERHKGGSGALPLLSVFGHADQSGQDEYNKQLSGRRAQAVYGALTHDVRLWRQLHDSPFGGDDWQAKKILNRMRNALGEGPGRPASAVIPDYLAFLCPTALQKSDFLGHGADAGGKADFQGCSEFNQLVILSKQENKEFSKEQRNLSNLPNRRVVVFLFRAETKLAPSRWPCPRVKESGGACKARFFSDADRRRSAGDVRRERKAPQPGDTDPTVAEDTFACRFYDRIARFSPCERILRAFQFRLFDRDARPLPLAPFVVLHGGVTTSGRANDQAVITVHDLLVPATCTIKWNRPQEDAEGGSPDPGASFEFEMDVFVDVPAEANDDAIAMQRLHNLGYTADSTPEENIAAFQRDYRSELPEDLQPGKLDEPTKNVVQRVYNESNPREKVAPEDDEE